MKRRYCEIGLYYVGEVLNLLRSGIACFTYFVVVNKVIISSWGQGCVRIIGLTNFEADKKKSTAKVVVADCGTWKGL